MRFVAVFTALFASLAMASPAVEAQSVSICNSIH